MREIVIRLRVDDDINCPRSTYDCCNLLQGIQGGQVNGYVSSIYDELIGKDNKE